MKFVEALVVVQESIKPGGGGGGGSAREHDALGSIIIALTLTADADGGIA